MNAPVTLADVAFLRSIAADMYPSRCMNGYATHSCFKHCGDSQCDDPRVSQLRDLATRIAALLPPEPMEPTP